MRQISESRTERPRPTDAPFVIGIADGKVARTPATFITHALGSCIGLCLYDSDAGVSGLLHILLPDSCIDPPKAANAPFTFADTGIERMLADMERVGARRANIVAKMAGGAAMIGCPKAFEVGRRNVLAVRKTLEESRIRLVAIDVGGSISRTVTLNEDNTMIVQTAGHPEVRR